MCIFGYEFDLLDVEINGVWIQAKKYRDGDENRNKKTSMCGRVFCYRYVRLLLLFYGYQK